MTLEIYWGAGSPYAWRCLLVAELKHVPYESKLLSFDKGDLRTPEFLALNPRGKVPVLRDGDFVLPESLAIMAYLDRKYPDPPIFGRTPEETGRIWEWIGTFESYVRDPLQIVNRWMFGSKPRTPELDEAHAKVKLEIEKLDAQLGKRAWLVGDAASAADIAWFPSMRAIMRANVRAEGRTTEIGWFPFAEVYPNIGAWIARVEKLPGDDKTFPPHWR